MVRIDGVIECICCSLRTDCKRYDTHGGCFNGKLAWDKYISDSGKVVKPYRPVFEPHGELGVYQDSRELVFIIPFLPPSKNLWLGKRWEGAKSQYFIPWQRWFRRELMAWKAQYAEFTFLTFTEVRIIISFVYKNKRERDMLNLACFPPLLDCLVECGILAEDNDKIIKSILIGSRVGDKDETRISLRNAS